MSPHQLSLSHSPFSCSCFVPSSPCSHSTSISFHVIPLLQQPLESSNTTQTSHSFIPGKKHLRFPGVPFMTCSSRLTRPVVPSPLSSSLVPDTSYIAGSLTDNISNSQDNSNKHSSPVSRINTREDAANLVEQAATKLQNQFFQVDKRTKRNMQKVLDAFHKVQLGTHFFASIEGYGHGDIGRDSLDEAYAHIFQCEAALVRLQFFSGTHAITCALFGVLRPGDEILSITGPPYDTLEEVLGTRLATSGPLHHDDNLCHSDQEDSLACDDNNLIGSLQEFGVQYRELPLDPLGNINLDKVADYITDRTRVVLLQKSCGYDWRRSFTGDEIQAAIAKVRQVESQRTSRTTTTTTTTITHTTVPRKIVCFVDNCYGEFTEDIEPTHPSIGADIMAGSLIKNCGGTIVPSGGYVAGKKKYVEAASRRLSAPGVEGGATYGLNRTMYQGLFLAPQMVGEAVKSAMLVAEVMSSLGYSVNPSPGQPRSDIIQGIRLRSADEVVAFCKTVQRRSPVGSYITPVPWATPGYGDEVVFASGTFIDGSTLELSADGPLRPPYAVYAQGGTHWTHWALVLEEAIYEMSIHPKSDPKTKGKE